MQILRSNISKFILNLGSYFITSWLVNVIFISLIAFFHFRLDHKLIVIENWIFDFAWPIATLSKICSFFLFLNFFSEHRIKNSFQNFTNIRKFQITKEAFLLIIGNLSFFIYFIQPTQQDNVLFTFSRMLLHSLSFLLYMFIDLVMLSLIESKHELEEEKSLIKIAITSIFSSLFLVSIFPFGINLGPQVLFLHILAYAYYYFYKDSYLSHMLFVFVILLPLFVLFGMDPVWGDKFSFYIANSKSLSIEIFSFTFIFILYQIFLKNKGVIRD